MLLLKKVDCTPDNVPVVKQLHVKFVQGCNHEKKKKIHTRIQSISSA